MASKASAQWNGSIKEGKGSMKALVAALLRSESFLYRVPAEARK